jgi:hypothetical protein
LATVALAAFRRVAAAAFAVPCPPLVIPGHGQVLYTKLINAYTDTVVPVGGAKAAYTALVPHVREAWLGPNGGRLV